ncbi:MAG: hypothetical protein L0Z47_09480 [Actinobacteria bacterium]|nr:hypothetical protein [Actinomycetota bacterium]
MAEGDKVPVAEVARTEASANGSFTVNLDPNLLPLTHQSDDRRVNLEVFGWAGNHEGHWFLSAQAVDVGGETTWLDPILAESFLNTSVQAFDPINERTALLHLDLDADSALQPDSTVWGPEVALAAGTGCSYSLLSRNHLQWEIIAQTSPASGQTGSATFTVAHTHVVGVALSATGGGWSAGGTSSITSGFSQAFSASSSSRNYRAQVEYGKYRRSCTGIPQDYAYRPIGHSGGTSTSTLVPPTFSYCAPVAAGTWSRTSSSGNSFSLSGGVQAAGIIGINLSATHGYQTSVKISYTQSSAKKLCGNNALPASAGRIDGQP